MVLVFILLLLLQDKIKYLEEKLKEEEHQRRLFQDKACEVSSILYLDGDCVSLRASFS